MHLQAVAVFVAVFAREAVLLDVRVALVVVIEKRMEGVGNCLELAIYDSKSFTDHIHLVA